MPPDADKKKDDSDGVDASDAGAPESSEWDAGADTTVEDGATLETTIGFDLNFNAYADNVPPTQHARRVAKINDPSVQDFADQALELATLRAELKRLNRDYVSLQRVIRQRDKRLQTLQDDLAIARTQLRDAHSQLSEVRSHPAVATKDTVSQNHRPSLQVEVPPVSEIPPSNEAPIEQELSATQTLADPQIETSATIAPLTHKSLAARPVPLRRLIPVGHDGDAIVLSREVITIGRTSKNDICIASRAVSRDHARLLISASGVTIVDMDSANGCFVNDQPVKRQRLRAGDVLRIGDRSYRFATDSSPAQQNPEDSANR